MSAELRWKLKEFHKRHLGGLFHNNYSFQNRTESLAELNVHQCNTAIVSPQLFPESWTSSAICGKLEDFFQQMGSLPD